ncbi:MAG: glyoxylate/hydroxypyruvate reductase A [Marinilabiliales bacterium]|nr:MAG: glyoxylate/hydroxypyruvate reductase A [Marinilabiliales bacterium]
MAIHVVCDLENIEPWVRALKNADSSVEVVTIDNVTDKSSVEFVLAWTYPHGMFEQYPELKTISSMGAGVDHLMNDPLLPPEVSVVRLVDPLLSQDIYEFSLAVIMSRMRRLSLFRDMQSQKIWKRKRYMRIADVTIGIMGTGVIGNHIATQLHNAGFRVAGWSRTPGEPAPYRKYHGKSQMDRFLGETNILICLLPLTPETENILNRETLEKLPEGSWLINIGRGGHLVDNDLMELLDSGHLDGANLDVFREEPLPASHPFWDHPKIEITPHMASLPLPASVAPQIIDNYHRTLNNKPLLNKVDRNRGY